jgi:hypothetical protein
MECFKIKVMTVESDGAIISEPSTKYLDSVNKQLGFLFTILNISLLLTIPLKGCSKNKMRKVEKGNVVLQIFPICLNAKVKLS